MLLGSVLAKYGGDMTDDPLAHRRKNEEEYFQKRDRELVEKMREQAKREQQLRELGEQVGVTDPELSRELAELGFTIETVRLLPLIPILETAWAEGGVSATERRMLVDLSRARGIVEDSAADRQLAEWLDRRPDEGLFHRTRRLISALFASGGAFDLTPDDLLKYCEAIAEASGGLFGIGRVSSEERATLERIATELKSRQK
jgi:hypothetical protein